MDEPEVFGPWVDKIHGFGYCVRTTGGMYVGGYSSTKDRANKAIDRILGHG